MIRCSEADRPDMLFSQPPYSPTPIDATALQSEVKITYPVHLEPMWHWLDLTTLCDRFTTEVSAQLWWDQRKGRIGMRMRSRMWSYLVKCEVNISKSMPSTFSVTVKLRENGQKGGRKKWDNLGDSKREREVEKRQSGRTERQEDRQREERRRALFGAMRDPASKRQEKRWRRRQAWSLSHRLMKHHRRRGKKKLCTNFQVQMS